MLKFFIVILVAIIGFAPGQAWAQKAVIGTTDNKIIKEVVVIPQGRIGEFKNTNYYWYENRRKELAQEMFFGSLVVGYWGLALMVARQVALVSESLIWPKNRIMVGNLAKTAR